MSDRRSRFRAYIKALDPSEDPLIAFRDGLYVQPQNAISNRIASQLELAPKSSHLIVGGTGSGKTTELIHIQDLLSKIDDIQVHRFDVPTHHRLDALQPGILLALAVVACVESIKTLNVDTPSRKLKHALWTLQRYSIGIELDFDPAWLKREEIEGHPWLDGVLEPDEQDSVVREFQQALEIALPSLGKNLVVLFDGMDRIFEIDGLVKMLDSDLPVLSDLGIGVVVIGPQHLRFDSRAGIQQRFDYPHIHGAARFDLDDGINFLLRILYSRVKRDLLPDESAHEIASSSGGLVRDMLSIARMAGEEAYSSGSDIISSAHIHRATIRFGRGLLLGASEAMLDALSNLNPAQGKPGRRYPNFTPATQLSVDLLLHRLMIEIPEYPPWYQMHPAIEPIISNLRRSA